MIVFFSREITEGKKCVAGVNNRSDHGNQGTEDLRKNTGNDDRSESECLQLETFS